MDQDEIRPNTVSAAALMGNPVMSLEGESLGKVEEIILDLDGGVIAFAVLSLTDILGKENMRYAMPWEALEVNPENLTLILDVERELLENAPGFDRNKWPDTTFEWLGGIYEYYGFEPYWLYEDDFDDFDEDDFGPG
jgi:sporulation protein YlmC with PRC-barrel domain